MNKISKVTHILQPAWKLAVLGIWVLLVCAGSNVHAQVENAFTIHIGRPAEGETYYAGPTSLMYSIPIRGWVKGYGDRPEDFTIHLEIFKDSELVDQGWTQLTPDGAYVFYANVNPTAELRLFAAEQGACAFACHLQATMDLTGGNLTIRATAIRADGVKAQTEVNIIIDRSGTATIPVVVQHAGESDLPLEDIRLHAATYLYLWRARSSQGATDQQGSADLTVEALSEVPTVYEIQIESGVVNGIYYEGVSAEEVILAPGDTSARKVTLQVRARLGQLSGKLNLLGQLEQPLSEVTLISLGDGKVFTSPVSVDGGFSFTDIPIQRYALLVDPSALDSRQLVSEPMIINLLEEFDTDVSLLVEPASRQALKGTIFAEGSSWLPFAWIEQVGQTGFEMTSPDSGEITWPDLPEENKALIANAPGYYSQEIPALEIDPSQGISVELEPQPGTQEIPWGNGAVVIPVDTQAQIQPGRINIDSGWIWGEGGEQPLEIRAGMYEITIQSGRFAMELLPNQREWLYLFSGSAEVRDTRDGAVVSIPADHMINLNSAEEISALPYYPGIIDSLAPIGTPPATRIWKPTLFSRVQAMVKQLGVGTVQVVTIATYTIGFLFLVVFPIILLFSGRKEQADPSKNE